MEKKIGKPASGVVWDLSELYSSPEDPKIQKDIKKIEKKTDLLIAKYKGTLKNEDVSSDYLLEFLSNYEKFSEEWFRVGFYAYCLFSKNSLDSKITNLYQKAQEFNNNIASKLQWVDLELMALPKSTFESLLKNKRLKENYSQYLKGIRKFKPFTLSEAEETLMVKKSQTGRAAFIRLYDELEAGHVFPLKLSGKIKKLNESEILSIIKDHPDRKLRLSASESYTKVLSENSKLSAFILNNLILDKKVNDEIRSYSYPQQATFLSYGIDKEIVDALVKSVTNRYDLCERYYLGKRKLLALPELTEIDRYSTLFPEKRVNVTWDEAKKVVLEAFYDFSTEFGDVAKKFFENRWIDAEVMPGKRGGAFCAYGTPSFHPMIFLNFNGKLEDIMTLAHELGHGVHAYLSRNRNYFEFNPSTATAEIASVFAEQLVLERLIKNAKDKKEKINLLAGNLQGSFATVFRQIAFYLFETEIHSLRRKKGELSVEEFSSSFQSRLKEMFGRGLKLSENHKIWWGSILHFYHYNFYVFTYAFGQALTLALYGLYKKNKEDFVRSYIEILKLGSSKSPKELIKMVGFDISEPKFWDFGMKLLEDSVLEFEDEVKTI